jgi:nucleoside-diphosphate-sugar epimerase
MRVLLTGGSGFTGGYVLSELRSRGHEVIGLARSSESAEIVRQRGGEPIWGDLDDAGSIDAAFAQASADCLINVASLGFGHAPTIVGAAENAGLKRAVFVSTTAIFTALPAPSKRVRTAAEATITSSSLDWTIIRPTMIYGAPGDRYLSRLVGLVRRTPAVPLPGDGSHLQQPVHVADLAATIVRAAERDVAIQRAYDVAGPGAISFRDLLEETYAAVGRTPRFVKVPMSASRRLVGMYEGIVPTPRLKVEQLDRLEEDKVFDISDARRDLDHDPRSFRDGIRSLVAALDAETM